MDWFLYDRDLRHERVKSSFLIELDESVVVLRIFFGRLELNFKYLFNGYYNLVKMLISHC